MLKAVAGGTGGSGSGGITISTTTITGGTNTRVLFDDNGVVGESAGLTFTKGNAGTTSLLFIGGAAVNLNSPSAGTLNLGTTAANALGSLNLTDLTGTGNLQFNTSLGAIAGYGYFGSGTGSAKFVVDVSFTNSVSMASTFTFGWSSNSGGAAPATVISNRDLFLSRAAAATLRLGAADVDTNAAIVGQTFTTQGTLAGGTADQAGKNFTFLVSPGKGTGVGGSYIIQTTPAGSTGTSVNAGVNRFAADGLGNVVLGSAAIATNATDGFFHAVSGAGTPTGTPTLFTGRVPIYVDTTNAQLWMYLGGAWKQPKTPAGAATVTWQ